MCRWAFRTMITIGPGGRDMNARNDAESWIEIGPSRLEAAVEVLSLAFQDDPLMKYVFSGPSYSRDVREVFRFVCEARLELGWPIIATVGDRGLTGVACLSAPGDKIWPASLAKKYDRLQASIGYESFNRMGRFSRLSREHEPAQPHYYLATIGVHPEFQGRSLGGVMLDAVHELSESHPESTGVYLETARQENVGMYEHRGYRVSARDKLDDTVGFWYMFRMNGAVAPPAAHSPPALKL
jgi:ribosomal protein S18 acetylase RimI-like enzyme